MKISFHDKNQQSKRGSVLLITLGFIVCCGISLAAYYALVEQEHRQVARSQVWNTSLVMAEAGVDEALAQMNATNVVNGNFAINGWSTSGTNISRGTQNLAGGSYTVRIVSGTPPTIYSTGSATVPDASTQVITRSVKVTTTTSAVTPFSVGLGAVGSINMNGNSVASDSWNSQTNTESTNGIYNGYVGTNGSVASVDGIVNIGNHTIDGNLYLGPTASYAGGGTITGTIYNDYNINFPDVTLPTTDANGNAVTWLLPTETSSGGKKPTFSYDFTSANNNGYFLVANSDNITVEAGVTVTLQVTTESFAPTSININGGTTNAGTVIIYHNPPTTGGTADLSGNSAGGASYNRPENFLYFGMPNVTSITFGGTSSFVGAIYAPEASLTLNGGGNSNNLQGAAIVNNVTLNGHYDFHYDTSLANLSVGPSRGYIPTSWTELVGH